ncbi:MAG: FtsX-like permease family protein [Bacteroidales bacterium]|nr:FtsX-like permease family protein [Bacteroidales bacterium]
MNVPLFLARRIRLQGEMSVVLGTVGVALAVVIMILSITIVVGFKQGIRDKVLGYEPAVSVTPVVNYDFEGNQLPSISNQADLQLVKSTAGKYSPTLSLYQPGVLKTPDNFLGLNFRAYSQEHDWTFISSSLTQGEMPATDAENWLLLSEASARTLELKAGDKVDACFFNGESIRVRRLTIAGVFNTHFGDYDQSACFVPLSMLRKVSGLDEGAGNRIELSGIPFDSIDAVAERVSQDLYEAYIQGRTQGRLLTVTTALETGALYFNWLSLLDTNVVVILVLMGAVAVFTLVSCLFILILERVRTIGILRAMGATSSQVRAVFVYLTLRIVVVGLIVGDALGLGLAAAQYLWEIIPLDPESYYLTAVPIAFPWLTLGLLNLGVLVVGAAVLLLPASAASRVSPSTAIRYE